MALAMATENPSVTTIMNQPQLMGRQFVPVPTLGQPPKQKDRTRKACDETKVMITNICTIDGNLDDKLAIEPEVSVKVQRLLYSEDPLGSLTQTPPGPLEVACQWFHIQTSNVRQHNEVVFALLNKSLRSHRWPG